MVDAWTELKTAKLKHNDGIVSSGELFDIEYYTFEREEQFIKHLQKIK